MTRGITFCLTSALILVSLAGCGRGFFQTEQRAPWRAEAEAACLKSGAVKEGAEIVRIEPIAGPGVCGAEFPLKVAALGDASMSLGFADDLRPPASVGGNQPRWPGSRPNYAAAPPSYPDNAARQPDYNRASNGPVSLSAPGVGSANDEIELPAEGAANAPQGNAPRGWQAGPQGYPQNERASPQYSRAPAAPQQDYSQQAAPLPRLGPTRGNPVAAFGPVILKPTATLACPIVSALDRWLVDAVQPAATRWFGARVVEIKQISAYSCRGMNGNPHAHISEHAFGNALDIAGFTLGDGRYISVQNGWKGVPEEQGFLRDVQGAACQQFTTVLAPGANVYHYNHIHVDLMRRSSGRAVCKPAAVSGEEIAARATQRNPYANSRDPAYTSSIGAKRNTRHTAKTEDDDDE